MERTPTDETPTHETPIPAERAQEEAAAEVDSATGASAPETPVAQESAPADEVAESAPANPVEEVPATEAPAAEAPAAAAPATEVPAAEAPATEPPATEAPATEAPAAETPATEPPATEAPAAETPADDAPAADAAVGAAEIASAAAAGPAPASTPKAGARLKARIVKLDEQSAFLDFGGREEAVLDIRELKDPEGKLTRKVGDELQVTVRSVQDGIKVSVRAGRGLPANLPQLIEAAKSGIPLEGKITGVNKGGLVVNVMGVRAFCPFSQIDRHYVEDPSVFVGQKLAFRISSADAKGRNVVLSRRALLEEEAKVQAKQIREDLEVGKVVRGVVARLRPFGAFVDLGGVDGLIHVSELSHSRVKDPTDVLKVGQEVEAKVRAVEDLGGPKERISLSMKELLPDPWEAFVDTLEIGSKIPAKVARLADFGAFLEISPGVDGLAHVSTLAEGRVNHPSDVIETGQEIEAWVVSVDRSKRRISLSLIEPGSDRGFPGGFGEEEGEGYGGRSDRGARRGGARGGRPGGGRRDSRRSAELDEYHAKARRQQESGPTAMAEALRRAGLAEDGD